MSQFERRGKKMARAIIRWSVSGERSNGTGNELKRKLRPIFVPDHRTATLEADGLTISQAFDGIREALDILEATPGGGKVDHVWIYVDE